MCWLHEQQFCWIIFEKIWFKKIIKLSSALFIVIKIKHDCAIDIFWMVKLFILLSNIIVLLTRDCHLLSRSIRCQLSFATRCPRRRLPGGKLRKWKFHKEYTSVEGVAAFSKSTVGNCNLRSVERYRVTIPLNAVTAAFRRIRRNRKRYRVRDSLSSLSP